MHKTKTQYYIIINDRCLQYVFSIKTAADKGSLPY